ncbi:hypothetical protein GF354_01890 [Candidatus Peregrinibacteria bacterium]|nr:hypothetical protein [Candidatus Peregrinibacteria bacterium]
MRNKIIVTITLITSILWLNACQTQNQTPPSETQKTFIGDGFSFTYPDMLIADDKGLWTEEGYERHTNPPENCDVCQIPEIEVIATTSDNSLDQQIISDFSLPGTTLTEMSEQTGIDYSVLTIGDNEFTKIMVGDMFNVTAYYTKHNNLILAFKVYWLEKDNETLKEIISSLKFE